MTDHAPNLSAMPVIEPTPRAGRALRAQETLQDVLDDPTNMNDTLQAFHAEMGGNSGRVGVEYRAARRYKQVVYAATTFIVGRRVFPRMTEQLRSTDTLLVPDEVDFDMATYAPPDPELPEPPVAAQRLARSAAYWFVRGLEETAPELADPEHPYHGLLGHLHTATKVTDETFEPWHAGPGSNKWPIESGALPNTQALKRMAGMYAANFGDLAPNRMAAHAVHHLIRVSPDADTAELTAAMMGRLKRQVDEVSADRHLNWTPDWRERRKAKDPTRPIELMPIDGILALLQQPASAVVRPNGYQASVAGHPAMADPDLCPHDTLRDGAIAKAGMCTADAWAHYPDKPSQQAARDFFEHAGVRVPGDFNFGVVALVMGVNLIRTVVLPQYEANRLAEQRQ